MRIKFGVPVYLTLTILALLLAACGGSSDPEVEVAVALTQTAVAVATQATPLPTATSTPPPTATPSQAEGVDVAPEKRALFEAPLFFIDAASGQIARLDVDGVTQTLITSEADRILDFDVSPDGTKVAYVHDNSLIELELLSGERMVKVTGPSAADDSSGTGLEQRIHEPHYSPDGSLIAFGLNGVNIIESGTDTDVFPLLASSPYPDATSLPPSDGDPIRFFWPAGWSPDGSKLLIEFAFYPEAGGLAIYDLVQNRLIDFSTDDPYAVVCCEAAWSLDSSELYLASNFLVYGNPGFSVVDAETGVVTSVINGLPDQAEGNQTFRFFRAPHATEDGVLLFLNQTPDLDEQMLSYVVTNVGIQRSSVVPMRTDTVALPGEVSWMADGSGVAYLANLRISGEQSTGSVVWLPIEGEAVELPISGQTLRFPVPVPGERTTSFSGVTPEPGEAQEQVAVEEDALSARLSAFVGQLWGVEAGETASNGPGINGVFSFPLRTAPGTMPLWVTHSTGLRDFAADQYHSVAIFTSAGESWRELARYELGADGAADEPIPDFLDRGSVSQPFIEPEHVWLSVEGGAGAHSGTFNLLSFDGSSLRNEANGFSASPGVARFADLNADGTQEVILDATDYYVFCYACGVRQYQYDLLRWNGEEMEQVALAPLPDDAPAALRDRNDLALILAEGGLWKNAQAAIDEGRALDVNDPTFAWNAILIDLTADARREAAQSEGGYPILDNLFYGDYAAAIDAMRVYTPAQIFTLESPLIVGTAAQGSAELLADWITSTTASALEVLPNLAPAHFLRGWSGYLISEENESALPAVSKAAAIENNDTFYQESVTYLISDIRASSVLTTPTPPPTTTGTLESLTVVNVRSEPVLGAPIIGELAVGTVAEVVATNGDSAQPWWLIVYPAGSTTGRGWVSGDPALVSVDAPDVEVIQPSPDEAEADAENDGGIDEATEEPDAEEPAAPAQSRVPAVANDARLFYSAQNEDGQNAIFQLLDGTPIEIVAQAAQPAIQPGGPRLAFFSSRDDMLGLGGYDLESGDRLRFAYSNEDELPTWDPDEQRIIFASTRFGDGRSRLYGVWGDGQGDAVDLGDGQDPDWHPTEDLIVFKGCDASGAKCGLWTMRPEGTDRQRLTENANDARPVWTRDGSAIIFMNNDRDGNWELYRLDIASGNLTRLTTNPANDGLPAVSPDGRLIAFMSDRDGAWTIQVMPVSGGPAQPLLTIGDNVADWLSQGIAWEQ